MQHSEVMDEELPATIESWLTKHQEPKFLSCARRIPMLIL